MPNTGKHQEVKSKQNLDGTFEFVVEDSEASESSEAASTEVSEVTSEPSRVPMKWFIVGGAVLLITMGVVLAISSDETATESMADGEEPAGFRPYKASGNSVEVPADAPSNEVASERIAAEKRDEGDETMDEEGDQEVVENVEDEVVEEPDEQPDEEFVEADEVIGDGEILDGTEEEMLESARSAEGRNEIPTVSGRPELRPRELDTANIQNKIRQQLMDGVNPSSIDGIRKLSPGQIERLRKQVETEKLGTQGDLEAPAE